MHGNRCIPPERRPMNVSREFARSVLTHLKERFIFKLPGKTVLVAARREGRIITSEVLHLRDLKFNMIAPYEFDDPDSAVPLS